MGAERLRCPEEVLGSLWERTLISGRLLTWGATQSEECCQALRLQCSRSPNIRSPQPADGLSLLHADHPVMDGCPVCPLPPALFGLAVFKTARASITLGLLTWASAVCASLMITGYPAHIP